MNMVFQSPAPVMIIGIAAAAGFTDVPDAKPIKYMPGSSAVSGAIAHIQVSAVRYVLVRVSAR